MHFRVTHSFVLFAILAIAFMPASAVCTNASFKGVFGYTHGRQGGSSLIRDLVGQITSDGLGNVSGSWTLSTNGAISTGTFIGTYSIATNCTGTLNLSSEISSPANFNIVLDNAHHGFQMIEIDNNTAQPGYGVAQGVVTCGIPGKKHIYATNFLGTLFPSTEIAAVVGQVTLDGKGNISGLETFSLGGAISTMGVTGTYTLNPDCTGTAQIIPQGSIAGNFNLVVVNSGKEVLLIQTDNNTLVSGTAQQ